jgi:ubiquinone/menaquinone biosynthesis C-methylase UbiE
MHLPDMDSLLPTMADYPEALFDARLPKGCRVGCGRAYFRGRLIRGFFLRRIEEAFRLLPERDYRSALDLGTGAGFYLPVLARVAHRVHGVDINPVLGFTRQMIRKKGIGNVSLAKSDATRLPFRPESFDLLFCLSLIEHIEDQKAALSEFSRVLRSDGVLILGYPLQNVAQGTFEWLNSRWQRARLFVKLSPARALRSLEEAKGFAHNHVSDFGEMRQKAAQEFDVRSSATVRLLGLPVYEILMAVRTPS